MPGLVEEGQVLGEQDALIEEDLPGGELEAGTLAVESVVALSNEEVGLGLSAVAVDQEAASRGEGVAVVRYLQVREHMACT